MIEVLVDQEGALFLVLVLLLWLPQVGDVGKFLLFFVLVNVKWSLDGALGDGIEGRLLLLPEVRIVVSSQAAARPGSCCRLLPQRLLLSRAGISKVSGRRLGFVTVDSQSGSTMPTKDTLEVILRDGWLPVLKAIILTAYRLMG